MLEWIAAGSSIVSGISSIIGGQKADNKAREAGRANARLINEETAESIRRAEAQFDNQYRNTVVAIGASGVKFSGTPAAYLRKMQTEQNRQLAWMEKSGKLRARAARKQGGYVGSQAQAQGMQGGIQAIGGAASYLQSVGY